MMNRKMVTVIVTTALFFSGFVFARGEPESATERESIFQEVKPPAVAEDPGIGTLVGLQNSFRSVAQKVLPAVVEVDTVDIVTQSFSDRSPFGFFFRRPESDEESVPREFRRSGLGSGVIISHSNGKVYVLTNHHVAGEADEITVTLSDGRKFKTELVGSDKNRDLALLAFQTKETIPVIEIGDSDTLMVGDWVLAIGNPFGFASTVTVGIVSGLGRETTMAGGSVSYTDYIQTDAAINRGNSGGALVNIYGQLVGINTWIASTSGGNVGLGFAIPINNAKRVVDDLINEGEVKYGWLGITVGEASPTVREDMKLGNETGGFVVGVIQTSPADKAGILPGDYITMIDGNDIKGRDDLVVSVGTIRPETTVNFNVLRNGELFSTAVTIAIRTDERLAESSNNIWPGFFPVSLTEDLRQRFSATKDAGNIVVGDVAEGSQAAEAGLRAGDIISSINGKRVDDLSQLYRIINEANTRNYEFALFRRGEELKITIRR